MLRVVTEVRTLEYNISELLNKGGRIHFVGIGGSGMFPIVQILHAQGYEISGSDVNEGSIIDM